VYPGSIGANSILADGYRFVQVFFCLICISIYKDVADVYVESCSFFSWRFSTRGMHLFR